MGGGPAEVETRTVRWTQERPGTHGPGRHGSWSFVSPTGTRGGSTTLMSVTRGRPPVSVPPTDPGRLDLPPPLSRPSSRPPSPPHGLDVSRDARVSRGGPGRLDIGAGHTPDGRVRRPEPEVTAGPGPRDGRHGGLLRARPYPLDGRCPPRRCPAARECGRGGSPGT